MLDLTNSALIGKGGIRSCYRHPSNPDLCIKIFHTWNKKIKRRSDREIKYINFYKSPLKNFHLIPNYYGRTKTNFGDGYIFERIKDYDGNDSERLSDYIGKFNNKDEARLLIIQMYYEFLNNKILVSDLHSKNILVQMDDISSEPKLILVDGFGNSDFIKICDFSNFFMKMKLKRKFNRLMKELNLQ
tara:strand:- start:209 stop:769 length:561 start_codon:yes stop_codon:yes gene_type:complete